MSEADLESVSNKNTNCSACNRCCVDRHYSICGVLGLPIQHATAGPQIPIYARISYASFISS